VKYLIIGHRFGTMKRGGYTIPKRFAEKYCEFCEFKEDRKTLNKLNQLNELYHRIILWTQVPRCYTPKLFITKLYKINHVFYLRQEHTNSFYNSCQNGFHYYRENKNIKHFIPLITDFKVDQSPQNICFGFYCREWLTPDSFDCFVDILNNLKFKVSVCLLGDHSEKIEKNSNVLEYKQTNDNITFFETITHYFYPTSKRFPDPFPHSVLEAVHTGKQIVFPKIERTHKDGIDDLKDCIQWHEKLDLDTYLDNSECVLQSKNFNKFYTNIFNNNFEYSFDREKYKNFREWIEQEVI